MKMTRHGQRERGYTEEDLVKAQNLIRQGKLTPGKASRQFKIPKSTLQRYKTNKSVGFTKKGFTFYLTKTEEASLKTYVIWMGNHNFPITYEILQVLCHDLLKRRGDDTNKKVSLSWCRAFLKRHGLSARKPRQLDPGRILASSDFDKIKNFFDILTTEIERLGLEDKPENIYNMDESGWSKEQVRTLVFIGFRRVDLRC